MIIETVPILGKPTVVSAEAGNENRISFNVSFPVEFIEVSFVIKNSKYRLITDPFVPSAEQTVPGNTA
jgi:hypothetical protein